MRIDAPDETPPDANRKPVDAALNDTGTDAGVTLPIDPSDVPWTSIGFGVAFQEIPDAPGHDLLIVYGGYGSELAWSEAWAQELYRARLRDVGVRAIYAIQGPADSGYSGHEIASSLLAAHLVARASSSDRIYMVAHSSGSYVAHELLGQLAEYGADPTRATADRIAYYNLEGGEFGFDRTQAAYLLSLAFVYAVDGPTLSANAGVMSYLASIYSGRLAEVNANGSGCNVGARWCLHDAVVNDHPHDPTGYDLRRDYQEFDGAHHVVTSYF